MQLQWRKYKSMGVVGQGKSEYNQSEGMYEFPSAYFLEAPFSIYSRAYMPSSYHL